MKLALAVVFVVAVQTLAVACPAGTVEYSNNCYTDIQPEKDPTPSVAPSDEKPPRDKMPSWQREGIHVDMGTRAKEPEIPVAQDQQAEKTQR